MIAYAMEQLSEISSQKEPEKNGFPGINLIILIRASGDAKNTGGPHA